MRGCLALLEVKMTCNRRELIDILDRHLLAEELEDVRLELGSRYQHRAFQSPGNLQGTTKRQKLQYMVQVLDTFGTEAVCALCDAVLQIRPGDERLKEEIDRLCKRRTDPDKGPLDHRGKAVKVTRLNSRKVSLETELAQHRSNLAKLRQKKAIYALGEEPLHLLNQIEAEEKAITELEACLAKLGNSD
jgi:hypothetical protein